MYCEHGKQNGCYATDALQQAQGAKVQPIAKLQLVGRFMHTTDNRVWASLVKRQTC